VNVRSEDGLDIPEERESKSPQGGVMDFSAKVRFDGLVIGCDSESTCEERRISGDGSECDFVGEAGDFDLSLWFQISGRANEVSNAPLFFSASCRWTSLH